MFPPFQVQTLLLRTQPLGVGEYGNPHLLVTRQKDLKGARSVDVEHRGPRRRRNSAFATRAKEHVQENVGFLLSGHHHYREAIESCGTVPVGNVHKHTKARWKGKKKDKNMT